MTNKNPEWRQFEIAVARFVEAIDKTAKVTHDVQLPDAHTGYPRQRDVWVEWPIGEHFTAKALISCKYWNSPLDQQDIDHFNGEFISSKADIGIIYARQGFNERAIEKAKVLGFHCCKLYRDEPAELPESLILGLAYHFRPRFQIQVKGETETYGFKKWEDVFAIPVGEKTILDLLANEFDKFQYCKDVKERWRMAREGYAGVVYMRERGLVPLDITIRCIDRAFQAKIEYTMLEGSYNVTKGKFLGSQATPFIDTQSSNPGPGWSELEEIPANIPDKVIVMFFQGDSVKWLQEFGKTAFPQARDEIA